jgi:hypothetical protein
LRVSALHGTIGATGAAAPEVHMGQNPRRIGTIVWAALVAGALAFFAATLYVTMPGDAGLVPVMLPVAAGLAVVDVAASWLWAVRMRVPAPPGGPAPSPDAAALTRLIVASALCEGAALFALVAFLVTRDAVMLAPFGVSLVALLAHFPGDRHWARLVGSPAAAPRRNPMIRE